MIHRPPGSWIVDEEGNITGPNMADAAMAARFNVVELNAPVADTKAIPMPEETAAEDPAADNKGGTTE